MLVQELGLRDLQAGMHGKKTLGKRMLIHENSGADSSKNHNEGSVRYLIGSE